MSVNPGFGGQKFIENTYHKVSELKEIIIAYNCKTLIEIDGGVDLENYKNLINKGADVLVAGNAVFGSKNPVATISELKSFNTKKNYPFNLVFFNSKIQNIVNKIVWLVIVYCGLMKNASCRVIPGKELTSIKIISVRGPSYTRTKASIRQYPVTFKAFAALLNTDLTCKEICERSSKFCE